MAGAQQLGFDREKFKQALYNRTVHHVQSARQHIVLPIGDERAIAAQMGSQTMRERQVDQMMNVGQQDTHRNLVKMQAQRNTELERKIKTPRRVPAENATEYHSTYNRWAENLRKPLTECYMMTYNDSKTQTQTLVDISQYDRSQLKTACAGWGPSMRQVYLPDLETSNPRVHKHYHKLGVRHRYVDETGNGSWYGTESVKLKPLGVPEYDHAPTEYQGQYEKVLMACQGKKVARTTHNLDGVCDYEMHNESLLTKIREVRQRRDMSLMNYIKKADPDGAPDAVTVEAPPAKSTCSANAIGLVHKDMALSTSYTGPCALTHERSGGYHGPAKVIAPNDESITFEMSTRSHGKPHKNLFMRRGSKFFEEALRAPGQPAPSPKSPGGRSPRSPGARQNSLDRAMSGLKYLVPEVNAVGGLGDPNKFPVGSPLRQTSKRNFAIGKLEKKQSFNESRRGADALY